MASEPRKGQQTVFGQAGMASDLISIQTDILGDAYSIQMDLYETAVEIVVEMDLPGMELSEITVTTQDNWLLVEGLKKDTCEETKVNYLCMERVFGPVRRMIQLPCPINQQEVRATYKNGVLLIRAPRLTDRRRKTHRILIEGE